MEEEEKKAKAIENGEVEEVKKPDTRPKNDKAGVDDNEK